MTIVMELCLLTGARRRSLTVGHDPRSLSYREASSCLRTVFFDSYTIATRGPSLSSWSKSTFFREEKARRNTRSGFLADLGCRYDERRCEKGAYD